MSLKYCVLGGSMLGWIRGSWSFSCLSRDRRVIGEDVCVRWGNSQQYKFISSRGVENDVYR